MRTLAIEDVLVPPSQMTDAHESHPVMDILDKLETLGRADHDVKLEHVVQAFGGTAFVPMLMVHALIVLSPLSGIPFLPTLFGLLIALTALQMVLGKRRLWLPGFLLCREVSSGRLLRALTWLRRPADWLDQRAKRRFTFLTGQPLVLIPQLTCVACGTAMPFLEIVPFSSSLLAAAVICFSVSFLVRDGLFVILGGVFVGLALLVLGLVYGGALMALTAT